MDKLSYWMTLASTITVESLLLWGVLCLLCALVMLIIYRTYFHPLAHIPGPKFAKVSGHWRDSRYWRGTWHQDVVEVHREFGPVVRIAPNEISVVDQQAMKLLYGHGHNATKTEWYATWDPPIGAPAFFAVRDKKLHSFLRKRVSGAYTMSAILKYEPLIQECLTLMLQQLAKQAVIGKTVNMSDWTNAFAFDVIGQLAYGAPLGHLATQTDVLDLRKNIYDLFYYSSCMGNYPFQMRILQSPLTQKFLSLIGAPNKFPDFLNWSVQRVKIRVDAYKPGEDHHNKTTDRSDMLSHFIKMKGLNESPLRFDEVLSEALNLVGAGADTTSIAIRACIFEICSHEDVYKKLQRDIDEFYDANQLEEPITYLQCQKISYLVAVTREAMRLLPSIVWQLVRHIPEGGLTVDGKHIPAGTIVGISPIAQNRDPKIWGEDADTFRPARWLEDEEKSRYLESNNMTFGGSGPRMCVGRNIALVEVHKTIAQLLRHFNMEIVNKEKPWHITSYWFAYQHDFMVRLKVREQNQVPQ